MGRVNHHTRQAARAEQLKAVSVPEQLGECTAPARLAPEMGGPDVIRLCRPFRGQHSGVMESTQEAAQRYLDGLLEQVKLMTRSQGRLLGAWQEMPGHSAPNHNSFIRALAADAGWNMGELGRSTRHIKKVCRVLRRRGIDSAAVSNLLTYCYGHTLYTNTDWLRMRDQLETVLSAEWAPDPGLVGIFLESLENLGAGDAAAMVQKLAGED